MIDQKKATQKNIVYSPEAIIKYIEEYVTTDYRSSPDGKWLNINSEFTSDDKYRMGFNLEKNYVNDFKLGSMSLISFIMEHEDMEKMQAERLMYEISLKIHKMPKTEDRIDKRDLHIAPVPCPKLEHLPPLKSFNDLSYVGEKVYQYLLNRGITDKHIKKYNLMYSDAKKCGKCHGEGYTDDEDECSMCKGTGKNFFYSRVIIPTYENGNLVYLQGRTINDYSNETRYQNIQAPRLQVVYFYDLLKENEDFYISEGPIDAMTLFDYYTTSLLNTVVSEPQILKLKNKKPKRIIYIPDYDETRSKRQRVSKILAENIRKTIEWTDHQIPIGVFQWGKMLNDKNKKINKDINGSKVTYVDEHYITIYNEMELKSMIEDDEKIS